MKTIFAAIDTNGQSTTFRTFEEVLAYAKATGSNDENEIIGISFYIGTEKINLDLSISGEWILREPG